MRDVIIVAACAADLLMLYTVWGACNLYKTPAWYPFAGVLLTVPVLAIICPQIWRILKGGRESEKV